jgi:hypothetical protein
MLSSERFGRMYALPVWDACVLHHLLIVQIAAIRLRGGRQGAATLPAPPARGIRPLEPRFDAFVCRAFAAHGSGQTKAGKYKQAFRYNGGMIRLHCIGDCLLCRRGFGGTGFSSPNRGRGGEAPRSTQMAITNRGALHPQQGARGAKPARIHGHVDRGPGQHALSMTRKRIYYVM